MELLVATLAMLEAVGQASDAGAAGDYGSFFRWATIAAIVVVLTPIVERVKAIPTQ